MGVCFPSFSPILHKERRKKRGHIIMKNYEYIRFLTEEMVKLLQDRKPKDNHKIHKNWSQEWFGSIPLSIKLFFNRKGA